MQSDSEPMLEWISVLIRNGLRKTMLFISLVGNQIIKQINEGEHHPSGRGSGDGWAVVKCTALLHTPWGNTGGGGGHELCVCGRRRAQRHT